MRRELRRHEAMAKAARVIGRRDVSTVELEIRLERARVDPATRGEVVERLSAAGAVDDVRFAEQRARGLAERNAGDLFIRHDLSARGISMETIEACIESLEPETARARRVAERRGVSPKTARYLAGKGFSEDAIDSACGDAVAEDAPTVVR